jgi:hypothetical protein
MIELTPEQHHVLLQHSVGPARVLDRAANVEYVLVRTDIYERLKALLSDELPDAAPLVNEVMSADDAGDPYLESYQTYARQQS